MFDPLLWVLHHFVIHYAGQTTQGDTDDDDGDYFDQTFDYNPKSKKADRLLQKSRSMDRHWSLQESDISDESDAFSYTGSKSKKAGRLLQRLGSMDQYGPLQENDISDESDASSSMRSKSKNRRKGSVGKKSPSKPSSQQQSQPGSQPSTLHDSSQSDEMPLPVRVERLEVESYYQSQNPDQYNAFVESETMYFESEYFIRKELGERRFGTVYLAIKKSKGIKVTCKSIPKQNVYQYALESTPPPRCNLRNPLVGSEEQSVAQCMSPRPPTLYVAHEAVIQMYLSRPGHENPYVLRVLDYITLQDKFMLITDYFDGSWMNLLTYINEKIRLGIDEVRIIIKEVINAVINLKQRGVFHNELHVGNVLYNLETGSVKLTNFGATKVPPGWEERKFLQSLDLPLPTVPEYEAGLSELRGIQRIGWLLFRLLTGKYLDKDAFNYGEFMRETILPDPDPAQSELKEKAIHLVDILVGRDPKQIPSFEAILKHPFFD
ncbi:hypothetical protein BASA50_004358 [Batrachochytrium salamandrivorans]|uniref:non-specific serine/threonine protein kinase n=1 Tax=Batrachochytrium salamandrivorans TaxID=1357716 RepID=A0ABQ8FFJ0_9FUNG|nr:hypothetical protein BASA50_004358 [Batrachochytrium salamandrivorans]